MELEAKQVAKGCLYMTGWIKLVYWLGKIQETFIDIAKNTKKLATDDPRRVVHSLKMALALTLVSLIYYVRPLYEYGFGVSGMWAILTVVVVFEFSVGATISKGLNRGFATVTAVALGVGAQHFAVLLGKKGEPYILGLCVFVLAAAATFTRFIPTIKKRYDYGVLIFILTFSLVAISGYRDDARTILKLAYHRLSTILVGATTCMIVSIFICPVWAGDDLHSLIAENMEKLAQFLEGFGEEYFKIPDSGMGARVSKKLDVKRKSFLQCHKSVLSSKNTEETLANFARWEPCHGQIKLCHPWKHYLKIGDLTRQCAYQIEALSTYANTEIKAPTEFRKKVQESCTKMTTESSKAFRAFALSFKNMTSPKPEDIHVASAKSSVKELEIVMKSMLYGNEDLLALVPDATVVSLLVSITNCVEKISEAVHELAKLACFKAVEASVSPEIKTPVSVLRRSGTVKPVSDDCVEQPKVDHVVIIISNQQPPMHQSYSTEEEIGMITKFAGVNRIVSLSPLP